ncbi:uncharacterized protein PADG_04202 [Paracoccidioides brasiliensis Pb18]|uniref:Efflux pump dotC n=1 Tax=Paracoccidioides brasiliensis (strain Pb18) TaxID=502780 RepID=C1GAB6_PARBD|nr:uncharacterized protein PADG_04202 [Paracoccidioides brasiliensis Pb18]EEH48118.2 hypothetical protein PADG_04202 [Paracoccidioides brasiliensis Pb18]
MVDSRTRYTSEGNIEIEESPPTSDKGQMGCPREQNIPDSLSTPQGRQSPVGEKPLPCGGLAEIRVLCTEVQVTHSEHREQDDDSLRTSTAENVLTEALDNPLSQRKKMAKRQITAVMVALCVALFLAALDMSIIATALPTIAGEFKATKNSYSWMASSYLLGNASVIPLWGKLSDIWGRKPIIMCANILFLLASLTCALAPNTATLIAGRAIQGIGGGGLILLGQICVGDLFSQRERPIYYAMFGMTWAIAGSIGPVMGGIFTEKVTWRWCFYINLPFGGFALATLFIWLKIETPKTPLLAGIRAIDWFGTITIIGGTLMFLFGIEFGGISFPWNSATVICLIIFGAVMMGIFVIIERKVAKYPVMPMALFSDTSNIFTLLVNWSHGSSFIAGAFFLPFYFQTVLGASPIMSGVYLLPQVVFLSITSFIIGFTIRKTGMYVEFIRLGMLVMTLGNGLYIDLKPYTSWPRLIIYQLITGIGIGPNFQAPMLALQSRVPQSEVSTATTTHGFIRQLSTSSSIVLGGVIYRNVLKQSGPKILAALGPELAEKLLSNRVSSQTHTLRTLTETQRQILLDVYNVALSRMWIYYTVTSAIGCLCSFFIRKKELSRHHEVTKTGLEAQEDARKARLTAKRELEEKKQQEKGVKENGIGGANSVMIETV